MNVQCICGKMIKISLASCIPPPPEKIQIFFLWHKLSHVYLFTLLSLLFGCMEHGIIVPGPSIEPAPPQWKLKVLTTSKSLWWELWRLTLLLLFNRSVVSESLRHHRLQDARLPCPSLSPRVCLNSCPLCGWCHPTISFSVAPFLLPSIFPGIGLFPNESTLHIRWPKYWSFWISPSKWISWVDLPYDCMVWFPCSPRDSQESSPAPQFESTNSSVLSLLYDPTLISIYDYWEKHSFDYTDLHWQSDVSAF